MNLSTSSTRFSASGFPWSPLLALLIPASAATAEYDVRQIADSTLFNREPVISETGLVAWYAFSMNPALSPATHIHIYRDGERRVLPEGIGGEHAGNTAPRVHGNQVAWMSTLPRESEEVSWVLRDPPLDEEIRERDARFRLAARDEQTFVRVGEEYWRPPGDEVARPRRQPSGNMEIMYWNGEDITRITDDHRNDLAPAIGNNKVAYQKARGWPFGWEIMLWADGEKRQLTTNYYYDMGPRIHGDQVVWYGWDGNDYEIFLYDHDSREVIQVTDNDYDCVSPVIWDGLIAFEGYPSIHADIFIWRNGEIERISDNMEDDINPRIWNGQVVWQGFDGTYYQIYHYDGIRTIQLTDTLYDNINPDIRDGVITWMGYVDNYDAEIFVWDGGPDPIRLTDNDYEDRHPRTAGGRIVWQADNVDESYIFLAEPR